jgi:oxygen-dependent protoporphyrinogen oxidase
LIHGGLVKGALAARRKLPSKKGAPTNRSVFLTPTTGLAEIVEALVEHLATGGADLRLNTTVQRISQRDPSGYWIEWDDNSQAWRSRPHMAADGLVLAAPAYAAGSLLYGLDPDLAAELQGIPYVSTATVSLAYRQDDLPRPLDGYGYVIPRRESRLALACTWTSTKFPHRAPAGYALMRVFIGRAGQEDRLAWDEAGLLETAQQEVRQTLGITAQPQLERVFRWEQAMPQYNLGHPQRLERIRARLERWPGLQLAGNGYAGIGIPDCIHSGEVAAQALLAKE